MPFKDLIVERDGRKLPIKINRPEMLNVLRGNTFQELEQELFARRFKTKDRLEGIAAFLEKRKPVFKGRHLV